MLCPFFFIEKRIYTFKKYYKFASLSNYVMKIKNYSILIILFVNISFFSCQKNSQKVWLHRANDLEKAQYFQDKYPGMEIDLTYIDSLQTFLILHGGGHIEHNPVTIEKWLHELDNTNQLRLWLDFKNLNNKNKDVALNELIRLYSKFNMKINYSIVESWNAECLKTFKDAGFKVSYYIPEFKPESVSREELQKHTDKIRRIISENNLTTISGYYYQYEFMRDSFPDNDILIWYHLNNNILRNKYIQIANEDPKVKVLLVAEEMPTDYIN